MLSKILIAAAFAATSLAVVPAASAQSYEGLTLSFGNGGYEAYDYGRPNEGAYGGYYAQQPSYEYYYQRRAWEARRRYEQQEQWQRERARQHWQHERCEHQNWRRDDDDE